MLSMSEARVRVRSYRIERVPDSGWRRTDEDGGITEDSTPLADRRSGYLSSWWSKDLLKLQFETCARRMRRAKEGA